MATCSSSEKTSPKRSPQMCRVEQSLEGRGHCSEASTSKAIPVKLEKDEAGESFPSTVTMPDGEEMYLSERLQFDSRKPSNLIPGSTEEGLSSTSLPCERRGLPASQKPPSTQPPPWPCWPYECGTCINPPPNRTVIQVSDRPRANSLSKLRPSEGRKGRTTGLLSTSLLTRKTVTTPGNFAGK